MDLTNLSFSPRTNPGHHRNTGISFTTTQLKIMEIGLQKEKSKVEKQKEKREL